MEYNDLEFKIPHELEDYNICSSFVVERIENIIQDAIDNENNKIVINTNLKLGLPMENINKIAGPFVEAWALEIFTDVIEDNNNKYDLLNVEARERLNIADILLQFRINRKTQSSVTANVDVKATSEDIQSSGKSPNITSFARIRSAYIEDPDFIFIILSLKHKGYSIRDKITNIMNGIMEVVGYNAYDLKYLSDSDISYNPALGTGQIQVRDIHYVTLLKRTTWELCQLIDRKFSASKKGYSEWLKLAKKYKWIKFDE
ncbi:MAG: hypothetical protein P9X24_06430 [Candidatus Hatepunaea meridiana]|nr:hypothetical protein [Candidatus Hatepunaea meridiana]